jgi:hypothetical protein
MEIILSPWQLRCFNTRQQEFPRIFNPFYGFLKHILEMTKLFGNAVSHMVFKIGPNELIGIELRGIRRKMVGMDAAVIGNEPFNLRRSVNHAPVPQEDKTFAEMPKQMSEKKDNFMVADVATRVKANVKLNTPSLSRNADSRNSRYLRPMACTVQYGSLPSRSPTLAHIRNQREAALVKKDERDTTPLGVFLYVATHSASNALLLFRSSPSPVLSVSDNSIPSLARATRYDWGDRLPQTSSQLPRRSFWWSRVPWNNHSPQLPLGAPGLVSFSGGRLTWRDVPVQTLPSTHQLLSSGIPYASGEPNLLNNRFSQQQPADLTLALAAQQHAGGAVQAAPGFHVVS